MIPNRPVVLKGENAKKFEEYQNRKPTKAELDYVKQCDKCFREHPIQ